MDITLKDVLGAIDSLGTVGLAGLMVYFFLTGKIVSKAIVENLINATINAIAAQVSGAVKDAVKEGILEARGEWSKEVMENNAAVLNALNGVPCLRRDPEQSPSTPPRKRGGD